MMGIIVLAILAVGIVTWQILRPRPAKPAKAAVLTRETQSRQWLGARLYHAAGELPAWLKGQRRKEHLKQFKSWATSESWVENDTFYRDLPHMTRRFSSWLGGLSDKENRALYQELATQYSSMNIDLSWLGADEIGHFPELEESIEQAVMLGCLARWKAEQTQDDISAFLTFQSWYHAPEASNNEVLSRKLFARLVENGLITEPSPDLFIAPADERQRYVKDAVLKVMNDKPEAFTLAFKQAILPDAPVAELDLSHRPELASIGNQPVDLQSYDQLLGSS